MIGMLVSKRSESKNIHTNKNSNTHRLLALAVTMVTIISLTGCNSDTEKDPLLSESKQTLVETVNKLNADLVTSFTRVAELEEMLKGVQGEEEPTPGITQMSDGTGRLTFNTVDGIFKLPLEFKYPGSVQAPNASRINISDAIKVTPTTNWTAKLSGTTLELSHTNGIAATITVGVLDREAQKMVASDLQAYLTEYFKALPPETIKYSRIYIKENWYGMDAASHTFIDEKDATIRCGMLGYGEVSFQYFFTYSGKQDTTKDEVILSLIKTINVWDTPLRIE